jgi:RNA polymerase sigma-70 factor (ECF subfamily)
MSDSSDSTIVELFRNRDESAIGETRRKYGGYLTKIAFNVIGDYEDSEESVNDAYLSAWNSIPPHEPDNLPAFLAAIVRRISIDIFRKKQRQKRSGSQYTLSLEELAEDWGDSATPASRVGNPESALESKLLGAKIREWLLTLPAESRNVFVSRYYFMDSVKAIAASRDMSESKVKSILHRARLGLKSHLEQEGYTI